MQILINAQKISITEKFKDRIIKKFEQSLERLLTSYQPDLKVASLAIEKTGPTFQIKFDMNLPGCPINIKDNHKILLDGLLRVRDSAKRQIKKHLEKLRYY